MNDYGTSVIRPDISCSFSSNVSVKPFISNETMEAIWFAFAVACFVNLVRFSAS